MKKDKRIIYTCNYDKIQSKTIEWLRFPLMVMVCFIHVWHQALIDIQPSIIVHGIYFTFSQILARIAVPLFFIISGYYFFYTKNAQECVFNKEIYISKLQKRVKSLLIPYLFWNAIILCIFIIFKTNNKQMGIWDILYSFVYYNGTDKPTSYQFWFIIDLMYMCVISPIIYMFLKNKRIITLVLLFILWTTPNTNIFIPKVALFFFSLGAYFSINKINIIRTINFLNKKVLYIITILLIIADLIFNSQPINTVHEAINNIYIHNIFILFGITTTLQIISSCFIRNKIKKVNTTLSQSSFFLFAIHSFILTYILTGIPVKVLPHNSFTFLLIFFLAVIIIVISSVYLYKLLKQFSPKFLSIITGGR